jgi:hypothetical protein
VSPLLRIKLHDTLRIACILWRENVARPGERPGRDGLYQTFNEWHLGDNLVHLNFLRRLAVKHPDCQFVHACRANYREQLEPVVWPLGNIKIVPLQGRDPHSVDAWKNHGACSRRGGFSGRHPLRLDWVEFHKVFFADLARRMGLSTPIHGMEDLLFDYPAVKEETKLPGRWDVLVCNISGMSGQLRGWKEGDWDEIIQRLIKKGRSVVCTGPSRTGAACTSEAGLSVTGVGNVSLRVDRIIGCPCGPMWPTFNIWNKDKPRIVLLRQETVALGTQTQHARTKPDLLKMMQADGWF